MPVEVLEQVRQRQMGRPKKNIEATSMRIEIDAYNLARQASTITGENIVTYASRIIREQAERDLLADAEKRVAASKAKGKK